MSAALARLCQSLRPNLLVQTAALQLCPISTAQKFGIIQPILQGLNFGGIEAVVHAAAFPAVLAATQSAQIFCAPLPLLPPVVVNTRSQP